MSRLSSLTFVFVIGLVGCQKTDDKKNKSAVASIVPTAGAGVGSAVIARPLQVAAPLDVKQPPPDAVKTKTGLAIKKLVSVEGGKSPARNDTVMVNLTGWKQATGETFRTNPKKEPEPLPLANAAPGFVEGIGMMKKGERAMLWLPPDIGYREKPKSGPAEALVYEIEIVDVLQAPPTPPDLAGPPADAKTSPNGTKYVVVKQGTGADKARSFDTVSFHYSGWDSNGRLFDTSELRKKPATTTPMKQAPVIEEMLGVAPAGSRVRFWAPADKLSSSGKTVNVTGQVAYEIEILSVTKAVSAPPPKPADLAKAPANALKSPKGVMYRVLKAGKGPKPQPTDVVRAKYTGWTADGRIFETWVTKGEPTDIAMNGTMTGFADVLPLLNIGDTVRMWVPEELAYKSAPGKPQGQLVFDMELVEIRAPVKADPHGHGDGHGHGEEPAKPMPVPPAPPDVAGPPKDAKKTDSGVFYKVLSAGKGGPKPTVKDRVSVHYTGWSTDGVSFDSSFKRGKPAEFALTGVIKGWTDGLQVMSVGDKVRFWIPKELAYEGQPSRPQGMLVFDIELLEIKPGM